MVVGEGGLEEIRDSSDAEGELGGYAGCEGPGERGGGGDCGQ